MIDFNKAFAADFDLDSEEGRAAFLAENADLFVRIKQEKNREEMLEYLYRMINRELGGSTPEDALNHWEEYKKKHGIEI